MQIRVNDDAIECPDNCSLIMLLDQLGLAPQGLAIAVNQGIISKNQWSDLSLNAEDQVTLIRATAGG